MHAPMTPFTLRGLALALCTAALLTGCGDDTAPTAADATADRTVTDAAADTATDRSTDVSTDLGIPFACEELGPYCHEVAKLDPSLDECHEGGHDADPAWCAANALRCYRLCTDARNAAADAGADAASDASSDAAHDH